MTFQPEPWIPLADYAHAHHVLGAGACFIHPGNGNQYFWDCVQISGAHQNLNIYRLIAKTSTWEKVVTFEGTKDAELGFERGQCFVGQGGALIVGTTMTPKGVPYVTETGFQGVRCRIPGVDEPWSAAISTAALAALQQHIARLEQTVALQEQQLTDIETALGNVSSGAGLTPEQTKILDYLVTVYLPLLG